MNRLMMRAPVGLAVGVLLLVVGCGGQQADTVTGHVTFDGAPVESGEIQFLPADDQGSVGAGQITNGEYSIECAPGPKKVVIIATKEADQPAPDGLPNYISYIPEKYNQRTTLTAEVEPGTNEINFDLEP